MVKSVTQKQPKNSLQRITKYPLDTLFSKQRRNLASNSPRGSYKYWLTCFKKILGMAGGEHHQSTLRILFHRLLVLTSMCWEQKNGPPVLQQHPLHAHWVKDECIHGHICVESMYFALCWSKPKTLFGAQVGQKDRWFMLIWVYNLSFVPWVLSFKLIPYKV